MSQPKIGKFEEVEYDPREHDEPEIKPGSQQSISRSLYTRRETQFKFRIYSNKEIRDIIIFTTALIIITLGIWLIGAAIALIISIFPYLDGRISGWDVFFNTCFSWAYIFMRLFGGPE